jgi:hypothetical protein
MFRAEIEELETFLYHRFDLCGRNVIRFVSVLSSSEMALHCGPADVGDGKGHGGGF